MLGAHLRLLRNQTSAGITSNIQRYTKYLFKSTMSDKGKKNRHGRKTGESSKGKAQTDSNQRTPDAYVEKPDTVSDSKQQTDPSPSFLGKLSKGFSNIGSRFSSDSSKERMKSQKKTSDEREKSVLEERQRYLNMPLEEKRRRYRREVYIEYAEPAFKGAESSKPGNEKTPYEKIAVWEGDITTLEFDAIVNAANESLRGGGGVDGAIHNAAGRDLYNECVAMYPHGCETGDAKITGGYKLPAKYVIHTVGPRDRSEDKLASCYESIMKLVGDKAYGIKTVAIPCISTGIFGYPNEGAAEVALTTVLNWLNKNPDWDGRVVFCVFLSVDEYLYKKFSKKIFADSGAEIDKEESDQELHVQKVKERDAPGSPARTKARRTSFEALEEDSVGSEDKHRAGAAPEGNAAPSAVAETSAEDGWGDKKSFPADAEDVMLTSPQVPEAKTTKVASSSSGSKHSPSSQRSDPSSDIPGVHKPSAEKYEIQKPAPQNDEDGCEPIAPVDSSKEDRSEAMQTDEKGPPSSEV